MRILSLYPIHLLYHLISVIITNLSLPPSTYPTSPLSILQELAKQKAMYEEKKRLAREEKVRQEQEEERRRKEEEEQRRQREEMRQAALRLEEQERMRKAKVQENNQMNGSVPTGSKVVNRLVARVFVLIERFGKGVWILIKEKYGRCTDIRWKSSYFDIRIWKIHGFYESFIYSLFQVVKNGY